MSASVDIRKLLAGLGKAKVAKLNAALRAVNIFGEHVIGDAQQLTPVDTGALQASGTTLPAELGAGGITKLIGFNTNYAAAVHERLDVAHGGHNKRQQAELAAAKANHAKKPTKKNARALEKAQLAGNPNGQAKYLSTAMNNNRPKFMPFIAAQVAEVQE
jgi:hypothetical protein